MNTARAKPRFIFEPRPLTREDMAKLFDGAFRQTLPTSSIRNSHHRVARLAAAGLRNFEIAERTGRSANSISNLLASPAMQDLIAHYKTLVDEEFIRSTDEYRNVTQSNMMMAEAQIADQLEEAEHLGVALPLKDLVAISRDAADRLGYGKKSQVTSVRVDFASTLERAIARSSRRDEPPALARSIEDA